MSLTFLVNQKGERLWNNREITPAGFDFAISTLTEIKPDIVRQVFFEVFPGDFMSVDVGRNPWGDELVQNLSFHTGGDFFDGDIDTAEGNGRVAEVSAAITPIRQPQITWAKGVSWTKFELLKALRAGDWDPMIEKLESSKTNWDLGMQDVAFFGHPVNTKLTGFLNNPDITKNTTLIVTPLSEMTDAQFQLFCRGILQEYWDNAEGTMMPDTFIIPTSDYLGLGRATSINFPSVNRLDYLEKTLKQLTGNANFKIRQLGLAQESKNDLGVDRYVLYKDTSDNVVWNIPVDYTQAESPTLNGIHFQQIVYGQYSGVFWNRTGAGLYIDHS